MINESILTKSGLSTYTVEMLKYIEDQIEKSKDTILQYASSLQFPTTGNSNTIYIDKSTDKSYRWDNDDLKYYPLNDYENIQVIDGCC
jgi:hypothetical protein